MNRTRLLTILLLLPALIPGVWAQDSAPYPSRIAAQPGPRSVMVTWKDAEGYVGASYEVWRSDKELVKDGLSGAKLVATVAADTEAYEDTGVTAESFYAVLLKDQSGVRQGYFIPYRNKTTAGVRPDLSAPTVTARIKVGDPVYASPQIQIAFEVFPGDRKLSVFRRAGPITALSDLKDATLLGTTTGAQSPWKDTPAPGLEFYYAVLDSQAFADGRPDAFTEDNATDKPAGFPLVKAPAAEADSDALDPTLRPVLGTGARALPLPRILVEAAPATGAPLTPPAYQPVAAKPLPEASARVLQVWSKGPTAAAADLPAPVVLPEERSAAQTGAGRYLVQIQKAYLEPRNWKGATEALQAVLKLSLDGRSQSRARFYLGESYAGLKNYRQAFLEFLSARDDYPAETAPFLEALLSLLGASPE